VGTSDFSPQAEAVPFQNTIKKELFRKLRLSGTPGFALIEWHPADGPSIAIPDHRPKSQRTPVTV
jgi:hypothetical protein